jgi:YD repeat-containing protein
MSNRLVWDGTFDGKPVIDPAIGGTFILTIEFQHLGRPDLNSATENYTWNSIYNPMTMDILVSYASYDPAKDIDPTFLMLKDGLSDSVLKQLAEQFFSGSMACPDLTMHPILDGGGMVLDYTNLDPVDMVTGAYQSLYTDLRLEGAIPLSFIRAYHSRYLEGSLGQGFTHSYEYKLTAERGIVTVTMPGGEQVVFLDGSSGYAQLRGSDFTLSGDPSAGCVMTHKEGAEIEFNSDGVPIEIRNPDGIPVYLSYNGSGELTNIQGTAGSFSLTWDGGHITAVTDSAGG